MMDVSVRQSDRDGVVRLYNFRVYGFSLETKPKLIAGVLGKWLTVDQLLDPNLRPISETARLLIRKLNEYAAAQGKTFPEDTVVWPQYTSGAESP